MMFVHSQHFESGLHNFYRFKLPSVMLTLRDAFHLPQCGSVFFFGEFVPWPSSNDGGHIYCPSSETKSFKLRSSSFFAVTKRDSLSFLLQYEKLLRTNSEWGADLSATDFKVAEL